MESDDPRSRCDLLGVDLKRNAKTSFIHNGQKVPTLNHVKLMTTDSESLNSPVLSCDALLKLLLDHRVDACLDQTSRSILVFDVLAEIVPTYSLRCIKTNNEVVLGRLRNLLHQFTSCST